jgi:hypothetical protein
VPDGAERLDYSIKLSRRFLLHETARYSNWAIFQRWNDKTLIGGGRFRRKRHVRFESWRMPRHHLLVRFAQL